MNPFRHSRANRTFARGLHLLTFVAGWLAAALVGWSATITEDFATNPFARGWHAYGNTNLFYWNSASQNLGVTWDSSQTNSYFYRPLGTILAKSDAFSVAFDLQISDIADNSPQIAVGLFNFANATNANFSRPAATTPNLFEFDYYADNGIGQPSIAASLTDTNGANKKNFYFIYDNQPLNPGVTYQILLTHAAGATNLSGQVSINGQIYSSLPSVYHGPITDFRIDAISISSYAGSASATPAHGTVDNLVITLPPPPVQNLTGAFSNTVWQARFNGLTNWLYTLQRTADFLSWSNVAAVSISTGTNVSLADTNFSTSRAFYRVRAERP